MSSESMARCREVVNWVDFGGSLERQSGSCSNSSSTPAQDEGTSAVACLGCVFLFAGRQTSFPVSELQAAGQIRGGKTQSGSNTVQRERK